MPLLEVRRLKCLPKDVELLDDENNDQDYEDLQQLCNSDDLKTKSKFESFNVSCYKEKFNCENVKGTRQIKTDKEGEKAN